METDYQNHSEMCLSQHHYEQVGQTLKKKTRHFRDHIKYLKNFKIPNSISTVKVQLR